MEKLFYLKWCVPVSTPVSDWALMGGGFLITDLWQRENIWFSLVCYGKYYIREDRKYNLG